MSNMKLKESGVLGRVEGKTVWYSRLIAAGLGSSAFYPAEALELTGAAAFPVGTHIHADHQSWREWDEQPANSVKTIVGVIASEPRFHRVGETVDIDGEQVVIDIDGLYAKTEYIDSWGPFVEQIGKFIGLSVNVQCTVREEEHSSGLPIVEAFIPSPVNTCDLVTAPGAKGRLLNALESFHATMEQYNETIREDAGMTPEDIKAVAEALKEAILPALTEAVKPEAPVEDNATEELETALTEAKKATADVAEALIAASLPEAARKKVYTAVESGVELSEAIKTEQDYIAGLKESIEVGVHMSNDNDKPVADYTIAGW